MSALTPESALRLFSNRLLRDGIWNPHLFVGVEDGAYRLDVPTPNYGHAELHTYGLETSLKDKPRPRASIQIFHQRHLLATTAVVSVHFDQIESEPRPGVARTESTSFRLFRPGQLADLSFDLRDLPNLLEAVITRSEDVVIGRHSTVITNGRRGNTAFSVHNMKHEIGFGIDGFPPLLEVIQVLEA